MEWPQRAYIEATKPGMDPSRIDEIRKSLLRYCKHDTLAMVTLAHFLASEEAASRMQYGAATDRLVRCIRYGLPSCRRGPRMGACLEPWLHAELYAELKRRSIDSGWIPFPQELPYVTHYPVQLPSEKQPRLEDAGWPSNGSTCVCIMVPRILGVGSSSRSAIAALATE